MITLRQTSTNGVDGRSFRFTTDDGYMYTVVSGDFRERQYAISASPDAIRNLDGFLLQTLKIKAALYNRFLSSDE